jgi:hypothetical protein
MSDFLERLRSWPVNMDVQDIRQAVSEIERLRAELTAVRELMNCYNLGGWTDALAPMERAIKAERELTKLKQDYDLIWKELKERRETVKGLRAELAEAKGSIKLANELRWKAEKELQESLKAQPAQSEQVAWMWQHDETGRTGFVDPWQVENGWQKLNPRLKLIRPLYTPPQPSAEVCKTCNGNGMIGGFVSADSGYQDDPCPDCTTPQPSAEVERDAARLDWLINHADATICNGGPYGPYHVWFRYSGRETDKFKTARAAIDAAISKETKNGV